jgi:polyisoprenoid-binding protein YceI
MPLITSELTSSRPLPDGRWRIDAARSRIGFSVRKLGVGTVRGCFAEANGELIADSGRVSASGSVQVAGISTGDATRDAHLRGPGFFAADDHPEISFASSEITPLDERTLAIRGRLTIRGVERELELVATVAAENPRRLEVRGEIDRRDYGLTWNRGIEATGVVSTRVQIELDLELGWRQGC